MAVKSIALEKGQRFKNKDGDEFEILYHRSSRDVGVRFLNSGYIRKGIQVGNIVRGVLKDRFKPTVQGVGFVGTEESVAKTKAYRCWHGMMERAYSKAYHKTRPTYAEVTVAKVWHNFVNFRDWYEANYIEGYDLDKDLLCQGTKKYGPDTCVFLPPFLNSLISGSEAKGISPRKKKGTQNYNGIYTISCCGAYLGRCTDPEVGLSWYNEFRELYVQEIAELAHLSGLINEKTFKAFLNWKVK